MKKYRGAAIGGVADGHWIERDDVNITVEVRRKKPKIVAPGTDSHSPAFCEEETLEKTDYKFLLLLGTANVEIGVWAPQGVNIEQVVTRLVKCYNPRTGMIGTPAANTLPIKKQ